MKKFKALLVVACALLLVAASVFGTMAYLTSTDTVTNTFTVGKVKITLDEAQVGTDGKALTGNNAARVKTNSYKLMPGHKYDKDPVVTVKAGSEESYVRQIVTVTFGKALAEPQLATKLDDIFTGYSQKWVRNGAPVVKTEGEGDNVHTVITYEYRYNTTVSAPNGDVKLDALFTNIEVPEDWTNENLAAFGNININIVAHAIQADGFESADKAWEAFDKQ